MSWLSDFYRKHPAYRALRVARRSACSIHFELAPGVYEAHFQIRPIYSRVTRSRWMPSSLLADVARLVVAGIRNPKAAAQFAAGLPLATVLTLQPDATAGIDALLYSGAATTNYGTYAAIEIGTVGDGSIEREAVKFTVSSIPSNAAISAATLTLYLGATSPAGTPVIKGYNILVGNSDWNESQCTWNVRKTGTAWAGSVGCGTANTDYSTIELCTWSSFTNVAANDITLTVSQVQAWLVSNYGFLLKEQTEPASQRRVITIASSDNATPANRPKLVVTYTLPAGGAPIQQPFAAAFRGPFG